MKPIASSEYLSTNQAARVLSVSVSTVKRWVDSGVLPSHRTAGGHRKLLLSEVLALARQGSLPASPEAVIAADSQQLVADSSQLEQRFFVAIREGDADDAMSLVLGAYQQGVAVDWLADQVIAPALARLGHGWSQSQIDIWQEHRGTQICLDTLFKLKDQLERRSERGYPLALGGAPEGDLYVLPTLLAQIVLLDAGWQAVNLGPNTPVSNLADAIKRLKPRLVWLSVSVVTHPKRFAEQLQELQIVADEVGASLAIGGRGLSERLCSKLNGSVCRDGLSQLAALARSLNPRFTRPKRGRPGKNQEAASEE